MKFPGAYLLYCLFLVFIFSSANAGSLDDFEADATKSRSTGVTDDGSYRHPSHDSNSDRDKECDSFTDCLLGAIFRDSFRFVFHVMAEAGRLSDDRMQPYPRHDDIILRNKGDILLPYFRFDTHIQNAGSGVTGKDLRLEFGNGPFAFQLRRSLFQENDPVDEMTLTQIHGLYRMSLGNHVTFNLGLGQTVLRGNSKHSTLSLAFPFYVQTSKDFSWEIKSSVSNFNGTDVWDFDAAGLFTKKTYSVMLGIRRLSSPEQSISGPYIGFSFHY